MRTAILLLAALALGTPGLARAYDSRQFDYVCQGSKVFKGARGADAAPVSFTERWRIDLIGGRWCRGVCAHASRLKRVSDGQIVMDDETVGQTSTRDAIDRVSGAFKGQLGEGFGPEFVGEVSKGRCKLAPFTHIPESAF